MSQGLLLRSVSQKAEVTDAHEAIGQDVKQKAADKLLGIKRHDLFSISVFSISIAQDDFPFSTRAIFARFLGEIAVKDSTNCLAKVRC